MAKILNFTAIAITIMAAAVLSMTQTQPQEKGEYSKWEIYGGYSTLRPEKANITDPATGGEIGKNAERRGYEFSITRNLNRFIGLKFDYGQNFKSERFLFPGSGNSPADIETKYNSHLIVGGVQFKDNATTGRIKPFAHVLLGSMRNRGETRQVNCPSGQVCSGAVDVNGFAIVFGGGVDLKVNRRMSIRPIQVDYLRLNKTDSTNITSASLIEKNNIRLGAGIVFHTDTAEFQADTKPKKYPKYEIHGGFTYRKQKDLVIPSIFTFKYAGQKGYNASIKWNFQRFLGVEFEQSSGWAGSQPAVILGQAISTKVSLNTFTVGIQVKDNSSKTRIKPFGHTLFGYTTQTIKTRATISGNTAEVMATDSTFMIIFGGGLDIKVNDRFSLRPFQFDYLHPRISTSVTSFGKLDNSCRFGAGIVFH